MTVRQRSETAAVERATALAERYGEAIVAISKAVNAERSEAWRIQRVRLILAELDGGARIPNGL